MMAVPLPIASAARAAIQSLTEHRSHDGMTLESNHFARLASLHAFQQGHISEAQAKLAATHHRAAGRLKHGISKSKAQVPKKLWADLDDGEC